jgi:hypothetical protein
MSSLAAAGQATSRITAAGQLAAATEARGYLVALNAQAWGIPVAQVEPFAMPAGLVGSSAAGVPLDQITGIAPLAYWRRVGPVLDSPEGLEAARNWLERVAASEPPRVANATVLNAVANDPRLAVRYRRETAPDACEFCQAIADRGYVAYRVGITFAAHAHCVTGDALVWAPSIEAGFRRHYEGQVVVLGTAGGHELAITPNHPVLTDHGWCPAGLLREGDHLITGALGQRKPAGRPHIGQVPAPAEDVWNALRMVSAAASVPVTAQDFHGDPGLGYHEVEIVRAGRPLPEYLEAGLREPLGERELAHRGHRLTAEPGHRPAGLFGVGVLTAPDSLVSGRGPGGPLGGRGLGHAGPHTTGLIAWLDAGLGEAPPDRRPGHAVPPGEGDLGLPGEVRLDDFVGWQVDPVVRAITRRESCHVYNLQTVGGWYAANGIVIHNCRCTAGPEFAKLTRRQRPRYPDPYANLGGAA